MNKGRISVGGNSGTVGLIVQVTGFELVLLSACQLLTVKLAVCIESNRMFEA